MIDFITYRDPVPLVNLFPREPLPIDEIPPAILPNSSLTHSPASARVVPDVLSRQAVRPNTPKQHFENVLLAHRRPDDPGYVR